MDSSLRLSGFYQCEMFGRSYWQDVDFHTRRLDTDVTAFLESTLGVSYTVMTSGFVSTPPRNPDFLFPIHQDIQYSIFDPEDHLSMIQSWTLITPDQDVGGLNLYPCRDNGSECYSQEFAGAFVELDVERSSVLMDQVRTLKFVNVGSRQYETIWFDSKCLHETADLHLVRRTGPRVAWTVRCLKHGAKVRQRILDKIASEKPSRDDMASFLVTSFPECFPRTYGKSFARFVADYIAKQHL
jgi:hypothetical protein